MSSTNKTPAAAIVVALGLLLLVLAAAFLALSTVGFESSGVTRGTSLAPASPPPTFTGRVLLPDGTPAEYAAIEMTWSGLLGNSRANFPSLPDGRFAHFAVAGRTYLVEIRTIGRDHRPVDFTPIEITPPAHGLDLVVRPR